MRRFILAAVTAAALVAPALAQTPRRPRNPLGPNA